MLLSLFTIGATLNALTKTPNIRYLNIKEGMTVNLYGRNNKPQTLGFFSAFLLQFCFIRILS